MIFDGLIIFWIRVVLVNGWSDFVIGWFRWIRAELAFGFEDMGGLVGGLGDEDRY